MAGLDVGGRVVGNHHAGVRHLFHGSAVESAEPQGDPLIILGVLKSLETILRPHSGFAVAAPASR